MASLQSLWGDLAQKYSIHPETEQVSIMIHDAGIKFFHELDLLGCREKLNNMTAPEKRDDFNGTIEELVVPATSPSSTEGVGTPEIPITVLKPSSVPENPLIIIHIHGGGLIVGSRANYDHVARNLADLTGAVVVNIEYRLLPNSDDRLAPFHDCVAASTWVLKNKEKVGGTGQSKVGVVGDSAGGQLTLSVTNAITQGISFQVLVYPVTNLDLSQPSYNEFLDIPIFNSRDGAHMYSFFLPYVPDAVTNPLTNPSARTNLSSCPPTMVVISELDFLRDQGLEFAEKLKQAGVNTKVVTYNGVTHGFMLTGKLFPTLYQKAWAEVAEYIKSVI